jgi:predicted RNase H-like HicB family nuclease/DNA-binding XRE family transcriptional regulator
MNTTIPCRIYYSNEDSVWYVEAPGFYEGIMTYGTTLEEAQAMASDAISGLIESFIDRQIPLTIPLPVVAADVYPIAPAPSVAFALWLRAKRKASGMTLTDVADKLSVKYQVYQKLENPETANPTLKTIAKLERVFGETVVLI